jgi:gliding motility-associated-like protein
MRHFTLSILLLLFSFGLNAQQASLNCIEVSDVDGSVNLHFSSPQIVDSYKIYRADQINSSYFLVGIVTGDESNYIDSGINAASQSYSYFVEANVNGQDTGPSNKMRTILLNATNLHNGLVDISWNDPGFTPSNEYEIWRKDGNSFYILLTSLSDIEYIDTIQECEVHYYYQIRVMTNNCITKSSIRGGLYKDITAPSNIIPKNATIDTATGEIILSWFLPPIEDEDIAKYQIWMMNDLGGSSFPTAEVDGYHNLSIQLDDELVCDTTITFSITAQDECGNSSVWDEDYFIRTLNLHTPVYDICNDECIISWDSIYAWQDAQIDGIRVYRKEDDEDFEVIAKLARTEKMLATYGYERGVKYQFYIEAYSSGNVRTSTSCIKTVIGRKPTAPVYNWLRYATVENGEVHLKWQVDSIAYVPFYAIQRSEDGINYQIIDTVAGSNDTIHTYTDLKSNYYKSKQYYQILPFDSCLNIGDTSNRATTIYSKVESHSDGKALIEWTPYETMSPLSYYQIYRVIDTLIYPYPIAEIYPEEELKYIDDYAQVVPLMARIGYFVEAVGKVVDSLPQQDTARSNTNFLVKVSNIFMPSGFRPLGGITQEFKPIYTGIKLVNYNFKVLNRWGQIVFETHQPVLGWDGTFLGEYVPHGAYIYVVEYETIYGKQKKMSGMFMVL